MSYAIMINKLDRKGWVLAERAVTHPFYDHELAATRACDTFKELFGEKNVKFFKEIEVGTVAD